MANKKQEYQNYLNSEEWAVLRSAAYKRANSKCELCGKEANAIHHVTYPKNFSEDELDNLLAICKRCHMKLHGVTRESLGNKFLSTHNNSVQVFTKQVLESDMSVKSINMVLFNLCEEYTGYFLDFYNDVKLLAGD